MTMTKDTLMDFENDKQIETFEWSMPMYHEDWHKAEDEMGLVYIGYTQDGPDMWDNSMVFVKPEDEKRAREIFNSRW